jgi:anti-anti-sigma regulatory factor
MITIEKNEQFALIDIDSNVLDETIAKEIEKKVAVLYREGYGNYIFDFKNITEISPEGLSLIKKVDKLCNNENGILAITTENEELIDQLDESKIETLVIMSTKEEAVEAIYLNELENDFREEDDDSMEESGEENASDYN